MSRRTQRATKYIFSTLAQLSENFIFIYLGMALFTSAPTSARVTSYVKPLFIIITTVSVIFTRYVAVFPLSEAINFFHRHARGQRTEELPHSYQMMLFWAGLRGAVGVALAAGFTGTNAQTLRTTVLIVVVLTVLLFGGTTARMLEVLGIRTGVEDEGASSSEEDDLPLIGRNGNAWVGSRRSGSAGRWSRYVDDEPSYLPPAPPSQNYARAVARIGQHYTPRTYNHQAQAPPLSPLNAHGVFSAASSESFDSDLGEVLPLASTSVQQQPGEPSSPRPNSAGGIGEDGKWFQALDERYLLPLFSNATASRTFHARRAQRRASAPQVGGGGSGGGSAAGSGVGSPIESEDEGETVEVDLAPSALDGSRLERGLASPMLRTSSNSDRS